MTIRSNVALLLAAVLMLIPSEGSAQNPVPELGITIVEGRNAIVDETHSVEIVVRVTQPGARVIFDLMPGSGVALPGDVTRSIATSDANGIARSGLIHSVGKGADFEVEVQASLNGRTVMTVVHASNRTANPDKTFKTVKQKSSKLKWIAIFGGGAGAAAALAMMKNGGSGSSSVPTTGPPPVTATFGSPTAGTPQ